MGSFLLDSAKNDDVTLVLGPCGLIVFARSLLSPDEKTSNYCKDHNHEGIITKNNRNGSNNRNSIPFQ